MVEINFDGSVYDMNDVGLLVETYCNFPFASVSKAKAEVRGTWLLVVVSHIYVEHIWRE